MRRMLRIAQAVLVLCAACGAARGGEPWGALAGMREELEGQKLELRDELIAAHMSYLQALELSVSQLSALKLDDPRHAPAWARAEYLLETCYRLLSDTGEYDAFLRATSTLRPNRAPPAETADVAAAPGADPDVEGGLRFVGPDGRTLRLVEAGGTRVLVDAVDSLPAKDEEGVRAEALDKPTIREGGYVNLALARAAWLRARAYERMGRTDEASGETAALGMIRDWALLGPLDGSTEGYSYAGYSLDDFYGTMDAAREYPGRNGPVRWTPFTSRDPLGRLLPGALFRGDGMKAVFALALVHSTGNLPAVMRFGANAPAVVSVNHFVAERTAPGGLPDPDQEAFNIWLRKGWNIVLIRSNSSSEDWGLAARITLPDGSPFPGHVLKPDAANLGAMLAETRRAAARSRLDRHYRADITPEKGGVKVLSKWLEAHPDDARANFYLASFLVAKRLMEGPERFNRELIFGRAVEASGGDAFFTLMAARAIDHGVDGPDREENLRLVMLKSVADKGSAAALTDIGRLYLDVMRQPRRADEYADMALSVNPMSLRAGVLDYDVAVDMGWGPIAGDLLEKLVRRHPSASAARLRLGRASLAVGRHRRALTEFYAILGVDAGNHEAMDGAVLALGMLGQISAAEELLVNRIQGFPYDFPVRIKLAELYRTLGRDSDARQVLDEALAMAPDDPTALAMRAELAREQYAEGRPAADDHRRHRQELDLSPASRTPPNGWEFLYFQVEDRLEKNGAIDRQLSFAVRIYTPRAAKVLRHLGFWLEQGTEKGVVTRLDIVQADGGRESFSPRSSSGANGRIGTLHLPPLRAGIILEAEVSIRREKNAFLGDYFGHIAPLAQQAPVRLSRYMFTHPRDKRVFFRAVNGAPEAMEVLSPDGGEITRIWEMSNLPPFVQEQFSPPQEELAPCVQVSSFGDWNEFARWYWRLIGAQYHAPPELRILARRLGEGESVALAKLDAAAAWVARNIGHRDWEYGPYAFRPINARSVLSRLSADGKDRTLLLCLFAREYGLQAWPVLARMRDSRFSPLDSGEPALPLLDHFNHSLALVESTVGGDIFMDASNPFRPSGVMPSQLFGSPGVAIMPDGSEMVFIPDGGVNACDWRETADLVVDEDGGLLWEVSVTGAGTAAETLRTRFAPSDGEGDPWISFLASLGASPSAASYELTEIPSAPASVALKGRARLRNLAAAEEERVILAAPPLPGMEEDGGLGYPLSLEKYARLGERRHPLVLPHGFRVSRRIHVRYPREWRLANRAVPFAASFPFGSVTLETASGPGNFTIDFTAEIPGHAIAAEEYAAFREAAAMIGRWSRPELVWEKP